MNVIKLIAADAFLGKTLIMVKTIFDSVAVIVQNPSPKTIELAKLILKVKPTFTMVKSKNLMNLVSLVEKVNKKNLSGDIVECGVWNGGASAMMAFACRKTEVNRNCRFWLFDSFEGLPLPGPKDGKTEKDHFKEGECRGSVSSVERVFDKLSLSLDNV